MTLVPFIADADFTLYVGDALEMLRELPEESVHCVVTSPPYWGLRDYGTGSWDGGDPECAHRVGGQVKQTRAPYECDTGMRPGVDASSCLDCGALRVDRQLGLEATPEEYVARMVAVFAEVRRVLRSDGTLWLNIGDSYNAYNGNRGETGSTLEGRRQHRVGRPELPAGHGLSVADLKPKDLVGIPWMLAFALRTDGWWLRSEIIWAKSNPMPESVSDRPTKAHEQVFLLTKSPRYFFDADAIREPAAWERWGAQTNGKHEGSGSAASWIGAKPKSDLVARKTPLVPEQTKAGVGRQGLNSETFGHYAENGRNARSVWEIATEPYPDAHFATFPTELARRCILAGCPTGGVVLDPFMGSGTVAFVARAHGRRAIGIELNADYAELIARRTSQQSLLTESRADEREAAQAISEAV